MYSTAFVIRSRGYFSRCKDPMNLEGKRDRTNTSIKEYNCGGYALGTFNWFVPFFTSLVIYEYESAEDEWSLDDIDAEDFINDGCTFPLEFGDEVEEEVLDEFRDLVEENGLFSSEDIRSSFRWSNFATSIAIALAVEHMLRAFPDLRRIKSLKEIKEDEYGVIYACGKSDFHFVRYEDGKFTHKPGHWDIEEVESYEEAFEGRYFSDPIFFAKKKSK